MTVLITLRSNETPESYRNTPCGPLSLTPVVLGFRPGMVDAYSDGTVDGSVNLVCLIYGLPSDTIFPGPGLSYYLIFRRCAWVMMHFAERRQRFDDDR